jgi:hypothetical protein
MSNSRKFATAFGLAAGLGLHPALGSRKQVTGKSPALRNGSLCERLKRLVPAIGAHHTGFIGISPAAMTRSASCSA